MYIASHSEINYSRLHVVALGISSYYLVGPTAYSRLQLRHVSCIYSILALDISVLINRFESQHPWTTSTSYFLLLNVTLHVSYLYEIIGA